MREFRQYRRKQIAELRPYKAGEDMSGVSISAPDKEAGSPKAGDMIARNPKNQPIGGWSRHNILRTILSRCDEAKSWPLATFPGGSPRYTLGRIILPRPSAVE
jgi:hypothetical protein